MHSEQQRSILRWTAPPSIAPKRPYIIERDVRKLEERQVVTKALKSGKFKGELENVLQGMVGGRSHPTHSLALQKLQENVVPASKIEAAKQAQLPYVVMGGVNPAIVPINDLRGANATKYSVAERQLRCKLASTYRLAENMGWDELIYNHITARAPGEEEHFLLNPFGLHFSEITASSLVRVDLSGNIIDPGSTQLGINQAGYVIHSAIHQVRKDIRCIIHVHTRAGAAVTAMKCGLLPISQEAMIIGGVSYHDYRGIACNKEEREELARDLGPVNKLMILRNHGLLAMGRTVEEAFHCAYNLVYACEIQVSAVVMGLASLVTVEENVKQQVHQVTRRGGGGVSRHGIYRVGELEFEALMRILDKQGYCTGYPYKGMHLLTPGPANSKYGSSQGGAEELRREGRRQRRERARQRLQQKLRELEEREREDLASESWLSLAPTPAVAPAAAGATADFSHMTPSADHVIPPVHHMTASSPDEGLWSFLEQKKANHHDPHAPGGSSINSDSASSSLRTERNSSLQGQAKPDSVSLTNMDHGEISHQYDHTLKPSVLSSTFPQSEASSLPSYGEVSFASPVSEVDVLTNSRHLPARNHVPDSGEELSDGSMLRSNLGALLRAEKTAQEIVASTSAAVQRLAQQEQLDPVDHHNPHAVYGLNGARDPSPLTNHSSYPVSSAITLPDHQRHLVAPPLQDNCRQALDCDTNGREEGLDLGAVGKAQLTARRVAQSTGSAVQKLTKSLAPSLAASSTNTT